MPAIPPEDGRADTPKVLASSQRGLEDIAAGRTIHMSAAELQAYSDAAEAAREARAARRAAAAKPQES